MTETEASIAVIIGHYIAEQAGEDFLKQNDNMSISYKENEGNRVWLISFCDTGEKQSRNCYKLYEKDLRVEMI